MPGLLHFGTPKRKRLQGSASLIAETAFTVVDTELTGLNERKDSIVSMGAVRMTGGRIFPGSTFYRLVKPRTALTAESVVIHGITPSDVACESSSAAVLEAFTAFCADSIIVGHFVCIDFEFIDREMRRVLSARLDNQLIDTAELFCWMMNRKLFEKRRTSPPGQPDLFGLARSFDIPVAEAHHALGDAFITAQLLQRFLPLLAEEGILTLGDLVGIGDPFGGGDRLTCMRGISL